MLFFNLLHLSLWRTVFAIILLILFLFSFHLAPFGRNPPDVQGMEVEKWANFTNTVLTWDQNSINASHVDIELSLFDAFEYRLHQGGLTTFKNVPNSGSYHLDFSKDSIYSSK